MCAAIGNLSIVPIYDSIEINKDVSTLSYTIVYPNGDPARERRNIIEQAKAKEQKVTLTAEKTKSLDTKPLNEYLSNQGKQGYLKVISAGKNEITKVLRKLKRHRDDINV